MNESNKKRKSENDKAVAGSVATVTVKTIADHSYLNDFEGWLDRELKKLEAAHSDFATTKSNRIFFKR